MSSPVMSPTPPQKKHKKHKSEKREKDDKPGLKLILKVGSQTTPEHNPDFGPGLPGLIGEMIDDQMQIDPSDPYFGLSRSHHKKSKKKKKKKDKNKDREKRHKHHHKDKKRKREDIEENDDLSIYPQIGSPGRELRTCVIKKLQERTPLSKGLDHLLSQLEKKDPQNFFAWPVTDNIAPGYSTIITNPMDFSTMRQKIEENQYGHLDRFIEDFKLMCTNAMKYNHIDTVYYKASKKLLQAGLKLMVPEKLGWMLNLVPEITSEDVGFEITAELRAVKNQDDYDDSDHAHEIKKKMPATKFESIPDELSPEEILTKSQIAARTARAKLLMKRSATMGYLKQKKDGTTHLNILVGGDGVIPGTKKRPILLGQLCGKLSEGTSQLQGFREDRRNSAKPIKPLYYGAFGSYAPSYDSAFSNLSKEESDLVFQTYGSDISVQYAENLQDFVKDSDYATHLVDSLLDLLTGGDHSKTKKIIEENKNLRDEEHAVKAMLEVKPVDAVKINVDELKSLQDVGIDVAFLENMDNEIRIAEDRHELQQRLDSMCHLLEKLQNSQYQRLSAPPPANLNNCPQPTEEETQVAENITDNLAEIAKRVNPGEIVSVPAIRKALGVPIQEVHNAQPAEVANIDLESELRQFLESEPSLAPSPLRDDKTIEEILME